MVTISKTQVSELKALRLLAMTTYKETFGHDNSPEQLEEYFETAYSLSTLEKELTSPESDYYFIRVGEDIAGYLKVNWGSAQTEKELDNAFEVQRFYILESFQGQGLGKQLFEFALDLAVKGRYDWIWLGVWEHNYKAQNFYSKYGFEKFSEHAFPVSEDKVDVDWLLRKKLK